MSTNWFEYNDFEEPENENENAADPVKDAEPKTNRKQIARVAGLAAVFGLVFGISFTAARAASGYLVKNTSVQESVAEAQEAPAVTEIPKDTNTKNYLDEKIPAVPPAGQEDSAEDAADSVKEDASANIESTDISPKDGTLTVAEVADSAMPSMVAITNTGVERVRSFFSGQVQDYESISKGSGILIDETDEAYFIATNAHVVNNATSISVTFVDEQTAEGTLIGSDAQNDLAVLSVQKSDLTAETQNAIRVIEIGSSDDAHVGEQVVAIGNALGYGQSVSAGYLSAKNRSIETEEGNTTGLLQTDAAINPGNSGGALLNMKGQLIGINSAKYADTEVEGMGFAIPINFAQPILSSLISGQGTGLPEQLPDSSEGSGSYGWPFDFFGGNENGSGGFFGTPGEDNGSGSFFGTPGDGSLFGTPGEGTQQGNGAYLGIRCYTVTEESASYYGIPQGVYIQEVTSGTAAAKAGLHQGDIVTAIDGQSVATKEDLSAKIAEKNPGDSSDLTVQRNTGDAYETITFTVVFGTRATA